MKKIVLTSLATFSFMCAVNAQVKVGSNPTTINSASNFEVEATDGTRTLIQKADGKVGIGTSAPSNLLHVKATADPLKLEGLASGSSTTDSVLTVNSTGVVKRLSSAALSSQNEPWYSTTTNKGATTNLENIYQLGRVGIGTATPANRLSVLDATSTTLGPGNALATFSSSQCDNNAISVSSTTGNTLLGVNGATAKGDLIVNSRYIGSPGIGANIQLITGANTAAPKALLTALSNGDVGIGTTAPTWNLDVRESSTSAVNMAQFVNISTSTSAESQVGIGGGPGSWAKLVGYDGALGFRNYTTNTEFVTMRTGSGFVGIGTTAPGFPLQINSATGTSLYIDNTAADPNGVIKINVSATNTVCGNVSCSEFLMFSVAGANIGNITPNNGGTGIVYNTTSDLRLKENINNAKFSLSDLMKIKVVEYNFKADKNKNVETGFIAQELHKIYPQAVKQGTDELDAKGVPSQPWMVDYSRLTPALVKATQDLKKELDEKTALIEKLQKENMELKAAQGQQALQTASIQKDLEVLKAALSKIVLK